MLLNQGVWGQGEGPGGMEKETEGREARGIWEIEFEVLVVHS